MPEQYDLAAVRHFRAAEHLEAGGHADDAGYHFGICAENAVKSALREAGLEGYWTNISKSALRQSPMKGHWNELGSKLAAAASDINAHAQGRRAAPLQQMSLLPYNSFSDWHIDIRYADPDHVPISPDALTRWKQAAADLIINLVIV